MNERITAARIGTRGSALARAQTALVIDAILRVHPLLDLSEHLIKTTGDQVTDVPLAAVASGASGVFTSALERALLAGEIDIAVHSAKDLPTELTPGLTLAAFLPRADVRDVLISRDGFTLNTLPHGAIVGTSSPRRAAQLRAARPDLIIHDLRGNIDTRIAKALSLDSDYDAIVLARAGLDRLGKQDVIVETLSLDVMLPAPAQGAIAVQVRSTPAWLALIEALDDRSTHLAITAERAFLQGLGGGCALPVAAHAVIREDVLRLRGRVLSANGQVQVNVELTVTLLNDTNEEAHQAGLILARHALDQGARRMIEVQS